MITALGVTVAVGAAVLVGRGVLVGANVLVGRDVFVGVGVKVGVGVGGAHHSPCCVQKSSTLWRMSRPNKALTLVITIKTRITVRMISSQGAGRFPESAELSSSMG
jgi:hypothetical protein